MSMKQVLVIAGYLTLSSWGAVFGQNAKFIRSGVIEYDKTVNMYALIEKSINADNEIYLGKAFENYKQNNPQFKVLKSTLSFTGNKTLFTPAPTPPASGFFSDLPMALQNNIVYTDLTVDSLTSEKTVYGNIFLLKDLAGKIRWKITDETREIAGIVCRRANAIILDSVYAVAYYSDEILVSGGPESFTGLPGMILQVTLPHEHISWVATRIVDTDIPVPAVVPPQNGKPIDRKALTGYLDQISKNRGGLDPAAFKSFFL
jgi:GLPGLI family protein